MRQKPRIKLIEHHVKYKEIHGVDETVWMTRSEHKKLHNKLRKSGKCNISGKELAGIAHAAALRTPKMKAWKLNYKKQHEGNIRFSESIVPNIFHHENINYNYKTGIISISCFFEGQHGHRLKTVDI